MSKLTINLNHSCNVRPHKNEKLQNRVFKSRNPRKTTSSSLKRHNKKGKKHSIQNFQILNKENMLEK